MITTLDYWRRRQNSKPQLVEVAMEAQPQPGGFTLVLGDGRLLRRLYAGSHTLPVVLNTRDQHEPGIHELSGRDVFCPQAQQQLS
ncbi:MAG: hypothetical protein ABSE57_25170, partial [Bryobacteraceae bacterium]